MSDEHGTAGTVEIALLERERLADPQSGAPEHDDEAAESGALGVIAYRTHDRDDLLDRRRIGRILFALVGDSQAWSLVSGGGRRRLAARIP